MNDSTAAFLTDPVGVFGYLAMVLGLVFWASRRRRLKGFFSVVPPIILAYFIPTLSTTAGITPIDSPAYDWMRTYLLPVALLLLMITIDLRAILKLGRMALIMMFAGTVGIVPGRAAGAIGVWRLASARGLEGVCRTGGQLDRRDRQHGCHGRERGHSRCPHGARDCR